LHSYKTIKAVINNSNSKVFKDKAIILEKHELIYLNNILNLISIFVKIITKLQTENYQIIYYIIPEIYRIYSRLEKVKTEFKVSFILTLIN
jgi:hypothetical protein